MYYIALVTGVAILDCGYHENDNEAREYIESISCLPYVLDKFVNKDDYLKALKFTWNTKVF